MHKLYPSHRGYLSAIVKVCRKSHQFDLPASQLHSFSRNMHLSSEPNLDVDEGKASDFSKSNNQIVQLSRNGNEKTDEMEPSKGNDPSVQISHRWPEWVDLMELLLKRDYFKEFHENPFRIGELGAKEANSIRTACLNFARERAGLIRYFSRKDIQVIAGCGCPSRDRKVVNSGKRLRAHVGIHEGNVCSSCNLRGDCERAYVKAREDESGRAVDVMRILLTHGLDSIVGTLENKVCQNKIIEESVQRLLRVMVDYGSQELGSDLSNGYSKGGIPVPDASVPMEQGDWLCPKCSFLNFARNIRCLRCDYLFEDRLKQLNEDQDHLPLKKGDWICERCNFFNFAKNTKCLQCKEKPPKRLLSPGEWECDSCNYINFRKNMKCLKCNHRRPKASNASKTSPQLEPGHGSSLNLQKISSFPSENESNDDRTVGPDSQNKSRGSGIWRFVDDNSHSVSRNFGSEFLDFPIVGGKSSLSQNAQKKEKWKQEMLEMTRNAMRTKGNDFPISRGKSSLSGIAQEREILERKGRCMRTKDEEDFRYANAHGSLKYIESTDDDDNMAEWFGPGK